MPPKNRFAEMQPEIAAWRRDLHEHPEILFETHRTSALVADRLREFGVHGWMRRKTSKALERLRMIFEQPPSGELKRVTIAGFEPEKSPRFGGPAGMDPSRAPRRQAT